VGRAFITMPVLWAVATLIVRIAAITLVGSWSVDGPALAQSAYYADLIAMVAPWGMAGAVSPACERHWPISDHSRACSPIVRRKPPQCGVEAVPIANRDTIRTPRDVVKVGRVGLGQLRDTPCLEIQDRRLPEP
jgi:hypothetical protein